LLSGRARFVGSLFSSTDDPRAVSAGSWRTRTILPGLLVACVVTTAEGVETSEQFERLKAEGCTQAQGYFISPPRPAAELRGLLASLHPNLKAIA
jgi:predicted signal transduction protein with EAL and GGDEF domain